MDINIKYIASNTSLMMSLSVGYPQILASGYPDSKFTIRFSPTTHEKNFVLFAIAGFSSQNVSMQERNLSAGIYPYATNFKVPLGKNKWQKCEVHGQQLNILER